MEMTSSKAVLKDKRMLKGRYYKDHGKTGILMKEPQVVQASVLFECPGCGHLSTGKTFYRCFTKFAYCSKCKLRVIPDTSDREDKD